MAGRSSAAVRQRAGLSFPALNYGLLVLGLLLALAGRAQSTAPVTVDRLPTDGLPLTTGWRYAPGDDPARARPAYDDAAWQPVSVAPIASSTLLRPGIGWLRLRWQLDPELAGRPLLLLVEQSAATELYLNGRRISALGTLSRDPSRVRAYDQPQVPIVLPPLPAGPQVLAVRLALPAAALATPNPVGSTHVLSVRLLKATDLAPQQRRHLLPLLADALTGGTLLVLALLHLTFYYYNRAQRANYYFTLFALSSALSQLITTLLQPEFGRLRIDQPLLILHNLGVLLGVLGLIWVVRALYALYDVPARRRYYLLVGLGLLSWAARLLLPPLLAQLLMLPFLLLAIIEPVRLTIRGLRQRRRGAGFVAAGFSVGLLAVLGLLSMGAYFAFRPQDDSLNWVLDLSRLFCSLGPALGISLYLAQEFALDARLLQAKLAEVEQLSAQTLAQEQEKQALLAAQNETLEQQVQQRTDALQRSLTELRQTQNQLIQSEKMASLGELTAGIAHEIQNPLNFVNNFADVSQELVQELKAAQAAGDAAEVEALADDLGQNLDRIHQHGQRAAGIVRGMLEHSRQSTGQRAPTDLNALADEYLRLAYHGLRAKDKTFNAALETDFAPDLPLVSASAADLGRVLLNLLNNAFYAVQKRQQGAEPGFAPTVSVVTRRTREGEVEIRVKDNGTGIPAEVQQKIFQPFFTTKPTGEGTGLGLSLSYDIVTKGHAGTLRVESAPGEGSEFIVSLPA